jgi:hypothetical protein
MLPALTNEKTENGAESAPRAKETTTRERLTYRVPTLAEAFDLSPHYIRKEIRSGRLRAHWVGSIWIVSAADARSWLAGLPTNQAEVKKEDSIN